MARPIIGVSANHMLFNETYRTQATGERNISAVADVAGCMAMVIPAMPSAATVEELMGILDGVLLTGARPNVHPSYYGHEETEGHGPFDTNRDEVTLPLIRAAVAAGMPVLGVCRGIQEINVAFGGTLHPEVRDLPGRMNHRMPPNETDLDIIFKKRHAVKLTKGGYCQRLFGADEVITNSLHGQAVIDCGEGLVVDGVAEDGTIEAITMPNAPGFVLGVQWHAEYDPQTDDVNNAVFRAFGEAARSWRRQRAA
ncbi:MAG: gamma-glutamyl-gamma-aminobutyrate hydrolase family protein [Pikeienuella sp.]